jgi:hypothetical protein
VLAGHDEIGDLPSRIHVIKNLLQRGHPGAGRVLAALRHQRHPVSPVLSVDGSAPRTTTPERLAQIASAFLHGPGTLALSPAYDAAPTAEFAGTRHLALWISGQSLLAVITRRHLLRELASWGLAADEAADVIDSTLDNLANAYDQAARLTPEVAPAIVSACRARTGRLRRSGT